MKLIKTLVTLILLITVLTSCSELFQSKIPMNIEESTGSLNSLLSDQEIITQLSTPTQVFVSKGFSPDSIYITWQASPNAISYRLERAVSTGKDTSGNFIEPSEENYELISQYIYVTSYTDKILTDPNYTNSEYDFAYFYRISAENNREDYESSDFSTAQYGTLFGPAKNVKADLGLSSETISIYWDKVQNATAYVIYRSQNSNGTSMEKIGSTTGNMNKFTETISASEQGIEFYYTVYAQNSNSQTSVTSNIALGYALTAGAPGIVSNVTITDGRGTSTDSITISWDAVTAASEVKYSIYRTSSIDSSLTLLANEISTTTYTDSSALKTGIYYYYQIQAWTIDSETNEKLKGKLSESSSTAEVAAEGYLLSPPTTVTSSKTVSGTETKNYISWTPAIGTEEEQAAYSYNIYGDASQNGTFSTLLQSVSASGLVKNETTGMYELEIIQFASFYKIKTVNSALTESSFSSVTAPNPFAVESINVSKCEYSTNYIANSSGVYSVKISWSKPSNDTPAGYIVYRSTKSDSGFRKLFETPVTDTQYIDNNDTAKTGTYYYYKVLSVNSIGQGSNYSPTERGYGALTHEQYMREYNKTVKASQKKLSLMHKSNDLDKLGSETVSGTLSGSLEYDASMAGLGARIIMYYNNYADFYINNTESEGYYFCVTGNTNTTASMDASGTMDGTVTCTGMYPGKVYYDKIVIKGGGAGGGTYGIEPVGSSRVEISYLIGEE